jgi:small GTP-binding protein
MFTQSETPSFRVVLFGLAGVGKTSLFQHFRGSPAPEFLAATIVAGSATSVIETQLGPVQIQLMDTAGQERYMSLNRYYFRDADCVLMVVDGSDPDCVLTIDSLYSNYLSDIPHHAIIFLAVNKSDLVPGLDIEPIAEITETHKIPFLLVSALQNFQVAELFVELATKLLERPGIRLSGSGELQLVEENKQKCC